VALPYSFTGKKDPNLKSKDAPNVQHIGVSDVPVVRGDSDFLAIASSHAAPTSNRLQEREAQPSLPLPPGMSQPNSLARDLRDRGIDDTGKFYLKQRPEATEQAKGLVSKFNNPIFTDGTFDMFLSRDNHYTSMTLSLSPSSTIQAAIYYPDTGRLEVSFKSGGLYTYDSVPFDLVQEWQKAASAGSFFYHNIRLGYRYHTSGRSDAQEAQAG
jgi:hypothetical protein